ncbi:DUF5361 domain-containing protein [Moryella indoligenes]|nr:DUF5361 domain-containing protein [Moryella indoligenes]
MLSECEDELLCDLAEVYHIYDYQSLRVDLVATFACGLREDSRTMMALSGNKVSVDTFLKATMADRLNDLAWMQTEDGQRGVNRPGSILQKLMGTEEEQEQLMTFGSGEEYEMYREKLLRGDANGRN